MADAAEARREDTAKLRFFACIGDEVTRETVNRVVSHLGGIEARVRAGNLAVAHKSIDPALAPDLMLLDVSGHDQPIDELQEILTLCPRETRVLVIGAVNDVSLYRSLMALGIADYLVKPVSGEALHDAMAAILDDHGPEGETAARATRITSFVGARGGVGTTTIAASVAWNFVHEFHQRAALADLDLHFGSLALSLDIEPGRGLREALEHPERIDALLLSSATTSAADRLKVLAGEESLDETIHQQPESLEPLIDVLGQDCTQLVVDLPHRMDDCVRQMIVESDQFVVVTDLSLAGLRDTLRLSDLLKRVGGRARPFIVASQVGSPHRGEISQREFERGLGSSIDHQIAFDPKAATAMARQGKAMAVAGKGGKAAEDLVALAQRLCGREMAKKRSLLNIFRK
ncbi:MAG TPA: cellulose synthase operon protein YhjQ/BcsQ [Stellaceae bacterium]|nr:cellulose synthase operon protein YhjQ/BcsQ [Stellaceae bacterium]